jgi:hypothetical protein
MRKEDGYIGARVIRGSAVGTIIDDICNKSPEIYDFLVEFDDYVGGHDGYDWGNHNGKWGHCIWYKAGSLVLLEEEPHYADIEISLSLEELI